MASATSSGRVSASPHPWPTEHRLDEVEVALCLIDFQHDFLSPGGLADRCGYDLAAVQPARRMAVRVLEGVRAAGWLVVHVRVGRPAELEASMAHVASSALRQLAEPGSLGRPLVRGEAGHAIVEDLAPRPGELVIDKLGKGAFHGTELDSLLRVRGVTHLVLAGVTSDVCVLSTFRAAHDHGYETLVLSDATGSYWDAAHDAAMTLVTTQGGLMGRTATSDDLLRAMAGKGERSGS